VTHHVKTQRRYDSSGRRAGARARRQSVLDAGRDLFLAQGFAGTTVAEIATTADVSPETVYKAFGGKAGIVRALHETALLGAGPVPAYTRSDSLRANADPWEIVHGWSRLSMEVAPRASPLLLLVRDAALLDPGLRDLLAELDTARFTRMSENARFLHDAGHLRPEVTTDEAADLMWAVTAPEMYELLVLRQGWSLERYGDQVFHTVAGLLRPRTSAG